jgi:gustatory receptor
LFLNNFSVTMNAPTLPEIFAPIIVTFKILGINFGKLQNGRIVHPKVGLLQTFTYVTICAICTIWYSDFVRINKNIAISFIWFIVFFFRCYMSLLVTTAALIVAFCKYRLDVALLTTKISQLDLCLVELGLKKRIGRVNRQHRHCATALLVVINLVFNILCDTYSILHIPRGKILFCIIILYPRLVASTFNIVFLTFSIIMQERFKMINHVLEKYPIDKKYSLSHLVFLHTNLVKITQKLNSCFGLHLFLWIALCVALIVVESHALLYMFLYTRSSINDFKFVIISIKNILLYSFDVCYLSKRCSNLCTEASHFKTILLSTKINIESEENRNSVRPTFFTSNIFPSCFRSSLWC